MAAPKRLRSPLPALPLTAVTMAEVAAATMVMTGEAAAMTRAAMTEMTRLKMVLTKVVRLMMNQTLAPWLTTNLMNQTTSLRPMDRPLGNPTHKTRQMPPRLVPASQPRRQI